MLRVLVVGAGTMGHGIAQVAAMAGYYVYLYDVSAEALNNAMSKIRWSLEKLKEKGAIGSVEAVLSRIVTVKNLEEGARDADLAIEAVTEDISIKREVFRFLDRTMRPDAIIATNTSSLPISEIAAAVSRPQRVLGLHFFNPPVLMKLVEVVKGDSTDNEALKKALDFVKSLGKTPILVKRDVPGFIVNRILHAVFNIACHLVNRGVYSVLEVDSALKYRVGLPMGIFELRDFSGIDVGYMVAKSLAERDVLFSQLCPLLEKLYREGRLGIKSGEGFYKYVAAQKPFIPKEAGDKVDVVTLLAPGVNMAAWLIRNEVASKEDIDMGVKLGLGYPRGILEMADEWGVDQVLERLNRLYLREGLILARPDPLIVEMVRRGELGKKTGKGFYDYESQG
ncbi:3-hydroxyacyl-CoA dehydrogenase [Pyrobaculum aerophilum]|uniref:3-hydroxybutyryl-CoA dehydrogenase n=1 Tax=Pyrobaculum aerophilum TaxID=13773 RepID=A0A371QZU9_9CREN|nr:3-hydroxyacyl-CoA dehydrogenase [Pyrobaculum aerophilum]RFA96233.1 3-hydroxybutyryl-CoA dehydrogenase [Pyrobaculum aerophilum]RFB00387.1 3-hydroxybutyryl-CoA dehydrogenase [Pyrobaculum aerophilum]